MRLDGLGIFVKDMNVMVDFYKNVLNFEINWNSIDKNIVLKKDGVLFMMYPRTEFERMVNHKFDYVDNINGNYEISLSVDSFGDVDSTYEEVIKKGTRSIMSPVTEP